jgi:hypothetical protein
LRTKEFLGLLGLTAAAFAIDGYHPFSEDAETYLPSVERLLHPKLFPIGTEYFQLHAHLTKFPQLIAYTASIGHVSLPWALFFWQVLSFFLFILACWKLMQRVFGKPVASWAGVSLVVALSTMPVAGTALYLMDPFLNPRNIIAFAQIFAVLRVVERRYIQAGLFLLFGFLIHPLMTAFAATFCVVVVALDQWAVLRNSVRDPLDVEEAAPVAPALIIFGAFDGIFKAPTGAYDLVAGNHRYQFLSRWTWYEMLGAIAPLFIFHGFSLIARARKMCHLELLSRATIIYGAIYFVSGLVVSIPHRLEVLALLQPMRSLHLLYVLMLLFGGGLLGEYVLRGKVWRWVALFLPLSAGMCYAQRALYPATTHVEWPGAAPTNPWEQAFQWVRENTSEQAIFAINPNYMSIDGEDSQGFRAIAERSQLADGEKDGGVVEMFPQIGNSWLAQVQAQTGIETFRQADFERLKSNFGVSWVILQQPGHNDLDCPYKNGTVMVCRLF